MNCSHIKESFDFFYNFLDCKTLSIQDNSLWEGEPIDYDIEVIYPGFETGVTYPIKIDKINIIDLENVQEGIYCVKVLSGGNLYTKYIFNTCTLNCKLDNLIAQATLNNLKDFEKITYIQFLIDSIIINTEMDKPKKALDFYKIATEELSCVKCNC